MTDNHAVWKQNDIQLTAVGDCVADDARSQATGQQSVALPSMGRLYGTTSVALSGV